MDSTRTVRDPFLDVVMTQVHKGEPPEARAAFDRLARQGLGRREALQLISAALRDEMHRMLSETTPFDKCRYARLLGNLGA
jgi:hypothetical protein